MSYIEDNGYLVFNGKKSSDYGVWVNGGGTFNAPVRRVKEYVVPGRNGTLTIDEGVFDDIEHVYPAFIPKDFSANIEAFRSVLMANGGYVELEDSFHPNEYYRARYVSGLEADVAPGGVGGAFNLRFRRDPRRFLKSGREIIPYPYGEKDSPNLLPYPYHDTTKTSGDIQWTDNGDGTISTSGYQTSSASVTFALEQNGQLTLPEGTYVLSGCPQGGSSSTYSIRATRSGGGTYNDYGNGVTFSVASGDTFSFSIYIFGTAYDVNGLTFKPMIRNIYGENMIVWPYADGTSKTSTGVTFTATDGSISTSGTNTGLSYSRYMIRQTDKKVVWLKQGVQYKFTGCPQGGGDSTYYMRIVTKSGYSYYDYGDGVTFTPTADTYITQCYIQIQKNVSAEGLVFEPELRYGEPAEPIPYIPYWVRGINLYNPTIFDAKPLIKVTGYGTLTINDDDIDIASGQTHVYIDSEAQDCYTEGVNKNDKVTFESHKFPVLKPGVNYIAYSGSITKVEISPRWCIL